MKFHFINSHVFEYILQSSIYCHHSCCNRILIPACNIFTWPTSQKTSENMHFQMKSGVAISPLKPKPHLNPNFKQSFTTESVSVVKIVTLVNRGTFVFMLAIWDLFSFPGCYQTIILPMAPVEQIRVRIFTALILFTFVWRFGRETSNFLSREKWIAIVSDYFWQ